MECLRLQSFCNAELSVQPALQEFVELWNARKLPARLYAGIDGGSLRRTQHAWGRLNAAGAGADKKYSMYGKSAAKLMFSMHNNGCRAATSQAACVGTAGVFMSVVEG